MLSLYVSQIYIKKYSMKYKSGQWQRQFSDITKLLKKSINASNQYARNLFSNQQEFLSKYSNEYMANLKKIDSISHVFQGEKLFDKLSEKIKALTSLYVPDLKVQLPIETIKVKNKRIERVFRLIQKQKITTPLKINGELIRSLLQQESKFNMGFDLFIFKCFILSEVSDKQAYSLSTPPLSINKQSIPKQSYVEIPIIHGYFLQDVTKIIMANLPTLGASKTVFTKAIQSKQIRQIDQGKQKLEPWMDEDNNENNKKCFHYFGHAMQFDFFNSLVQPQSLQSYIRRFSIIEDRAICQGLILGALSSIPEGKDPQCSDSDAEQQWQDEVQKIAKEFCHYFSEYFQDEQQTLEVRALSTKLAILRRQQKTSLSTMLQRYWLK